MLVLKSIKKSYGSADAKVEALKGIDINFRDSEFVSILGPSGCGKTTLLNIIGGLDRYSEGDLVINGRSTKDYKDVDWDTYRNHEIGFVFQSYNLIPHLTVLGNVELALTLSGISKAERRVRAVEALTKVGLESQLNKRPNQLSGGQMQRVAIARAIVNNPNIILADEPTGALDTDTSIQVMEILNEIAKDRLVIMVTHNPNLAEKYSTRIISLLDGQMVGDSLPYKDEDIQEVSPKILLTENKKKKSRMSFWTSLTLSFKNMLTKKGRTIMISFAGSIGIIGIALVLALSNGFTQYINDMQSDMLSGYPVTISQIAMDYDAINDLNANKSDSEVYEKFPDESELKVYNQMMLTSAKAMHLNLIDQDYYDYVNDFYTQDKSKPSDKRLTNSIQYSFSGKLNALAKDGDTYAFVDNASKSLIPDTSTSSMVSMVMGSNSDVFQEALDNTEFIRNTYDVIYGKYPTAYDEAVLVVDSRNRISTSTLSAVGINYQADGKDVSSINFENLIYNEETQEGLSYKIINNDAYYTPVIKEGQTVVDYYLPGRYNTDITSDLKTYYDSIDDTKGVELKIVGVLRINENASLDIFNGGVLYLPSLTEKMHANALASEIYRASTSQDLSNGVAYGDYTATVDSLSTTQKGYLNSLGGNTYKLPFSFVYGPFHSMDESVDYNYIQQVALQGIGGTEVPSSIYIYPKGFAAKKKITTYLNEWNNDAANQKHKIVYTDAASTFTSSVGTLINIIKYVLIAFAGISLVVSSIMIGIITYVSVIERTKEIGVLRSLGARKKDIASVFNAETILIGFVSGLIGIVLTYILCIPVNALILHFAGETISTNLAVLNPLDALWLVIVSMILTLISGLIPASVAAKKDPVVALRTE